jgi:hypothetical protein
MVHENMVETAGISTQPEALHKKQCEYYVFEWKEQDQPSDQREMTTVSAGETMQVPFNDSGWAVNALSHLLQHPNLRPRIKHSGGGHPPGRPDEAS